jgi:IclR family mhp operon transcriptional activator
VLLAAMRSSSDTENSSLADEDIERLIAQARWRGYTERDSTAEPRNSATIAVPIKLGDRVLATFGVTFFRAAVANPEDKARIIHPLKKAAANIEAQLEALSQSMGVAFQGEK